MLPTLFYLSLCFMVAFLGRRTRLGFFRSFLFSVLLTPLLTMLYLLIFDTLDTERENHALRRSRNQPSLNDS